MAHFYGGIKGNRGEATRLGTAKSGLTARQGQRKIAVSRSRVRQGEKRIMKIDWSTINCERLAKLPHWNDAPHGRNRISRDMGNACCGDPPGYPTYFTQSVYTPNGNSPGRGPEMVLNWHVVASAEDWKPGDNWDKVYERRQALLHSLWVPLPLDHPRTRQWIERTYQHFKHCYRDVERPEYGKPGILIYPVASYKLKRPHIDPHWTENYKAAVEREAEAFNEQEGQRAARIANSDNHLAVITIQRFYPDYQPEVELIRNAPRLFQADWWEREAEQPSESECPGHLGTPHGKFDNCRYCGRLNINMEVQL